MERGRKNKSPFKLGGLDVLGATGGLTGMNRGRGGNRGRGRVTRDPNIYNPGRPATPTDFQQPEVDMEALQEQLAAYKAEKQAELTQTSPRPQPQNIQQFGQVGMMGAGGSGNSMYDRAVGIRDMFRNRARRGMFGNRTREQKLSRAQQRFNQITGRNVFGISQAAQQMMQNRNLATPQKTGIFGMPSQLPSGRMNPMYGGIGGALAFKRKPSGFKMKKNK